jgi:hypothetical protein
MTGQGPPGNGGNGGGVGGGGARTGVGGGGGGFAAGGGAGITNTTGLNQSLGGDGGFGGGGGGSYAAIPGRVAKGGYGGADSFRTQGGAGAGMGGAIFNMGGIVNILNSTFVDNVAYCGGSGQDGGSCLGAAIFNLNGQVSVSYSTLVRNRMGTVGHVGVNYVTDVAGDAIYSVAYNGAAVTGSTQAGVVINNSIIAATYENSPDGQTSTIAIAFDQPTTVAGGLTNIATQTFQASGLNLVNSYEVRNNAPALPTFDFIFTPTLVPGTTIEPISWIPLNVELLGVSTCRDASGTLVTTDQRGLPRPATGCDIGAVQRQRPVLATAPGSTLFVQAASGASTAVVIDGAIGVSDLEPSVTALSNATITITGNYQNDQDQLTFTGNGATMGNIAGSFASANGRLTLTSSDATATFAQWQAALRAVTYANTTVAPTQANTAPRAITFVVNDGLVNSNVASKAVTVYALIQLSSAPLPGATVGTNYSSAIGANGGTGSYTFVTSGGALPAGMTLAADGTLSGIPIASGAFNFTATATDGIGSMGTRVYSLTVAARATTTSINATPISSVAGESVTFNASIVGTNPTGTISFTDGGAPICAASSISGGTAQCQTSALSAGTHNIGASYSGDTNNLASAAGSLTYIVKSTTATELTSVCTLVFVDHAPFTVSANVSGAAPSGSITFLRDGSTALCTAVALSQSSASCTTTALAAAPGHAQDTYSITASYPGDTGNAPSMSSAVVVHVLNASDVVFRSTFENATAGCPLP